MEPCYFQILRHRLFRTGKVNPGGVVMEENRMDQLLETDIDRIAGFNRTDRDFPDQVTLLELIEARIGQHPLRHAVLCDHDRFWGTAVLSYAQLNERANQVAHLLRGNGVR